MKTAMPFDTIKIQDRVRSFDFEGNKDCYTEGIVEGIEFHEGCDRYKIYVDKCVFDGIEVSYNEYIYPPVNGTLMMFGFKSNVTYFVEKI